MKKLLLILAMPLLFLSCNDKDDWQNDVKTMTATVASRTRNGMSWGGMVHRYLLVKFNEKSEWQIIDGIEGFEHEDGYECVVRVKRKRHDPGIQDVGSHYYVLEKVISKEKKKSAGMSSCDIWVEYMTVGSKMTRMMSISGAEADAFYIKFYSRSSEPKWQKVEAFLIDGFADYEKGCEYNLVMNVKKLWDMVGMDGVYHMEFSVNEIIEKTRKDSSGLPE